MPKDKGQVDAYVVLRFDGYSTTLSIDKCITAKEVVSSAQIAKEEVERLNDLAKDKPGTYYFYAGASLYPPGKSAGHPKE